MIASIECAPERYKKLHVDVIVRLASELLDEKKCAARSTFFDSDVRYLETLKARAAKHDG